MAPDDFEHLDGLDFGDDFTFSVSLVRHPESGRVYVEVLHGENEGDRYAYAPLDVDPAAVDTWDALATLTGTGKGR